MEPYPAEMRNGVEVLRFFPKNLYWSFVRSQKAGIRVYRNSVERALAGVETVRWHLTDAWNRDAARRARDIFATSRPDILHSHVIDGMSASMWRQANRRGMPIVHTAHDYHLICPRALLITNSWKICTNITLACQGYRAWHIRTTAAVDLFTSPSRFLLQRHQSAGLRSRELAVIPNGTPIPVRQRKTYSPNRTRFLMLMRLTVEKGVTTMLDAMALLPADFPAELVIAGVGPLESVVRDAVARDPRITYLGYVKDQAKEDILAWADHMILPSIWLENAPTVILEAAAHGLGMIASRIGGIPEFVEEGRTGHLFTPGDPAALASCMVAAAADLNLFRDLPENCRTMIARYTVPLMTDTFIGHYQRLIEAKR